MPTEEGEGTVTLRVRLPRGWKGQNFTAMFREDAKAEVVARYAAALEGAPIGAVLRVETSYPKRVVGAGEELGGLGMGKRGSLVVVHVNAE